MPSIKSSIGDKNNVSLDDICDLIKITTTKDELGQTIQHEIPYMVFCSRLSILRSEFNIAGQLGHKPEMMLLINADSYDNESLVNYQGKKYSVYKTFQRPDHFIELYCEVKSGG